MAVTKVVVHVELEIAHADGLKYNQVHYLAKQGVEEAFGRGGYIANAAEVVKVKVRSVADAMPNRETRWR